MAPPNLEADGYDGALATAYKDLHTTGATTPHSIKKRNNHAKSKPLKSTRPLKGGTARGACPTVRKQPPNHLSKQNSPRLGNQTKQKLAHQANTKPTAAGSKSESSPLELASPELSNKDMLSQVKADLEIDLALVLFSGKARADHVDYAPTAK